MANTAGIPEPFIDTSLEERLTNRLAESFAAEEKAGRDLALKGRTVALMAVAFLVILIAPMPAALFYEAIIALFILLGLVRLWIDRSPLNRWWVGYLLTAIDFALLAYALITPNPLATYDLPPQMALRFGNFTYLYVILAGLALGYRPRHVLWGGFVGALAWSAGVVCIVSLPDTVLTPPAGAGIDTVLAAMASPTYVDLDLPVQDVAIFLIVASLLALIVARSRRLAWRQSALERERGNLARYFPPATVDRLAKQDIALEQPREQDIAVLFADLVGFTHWSERHGPSEVISLLREVHARFEEAVFRHEGTLDKFIGDGMMATFGTPEPGPRDASNALACLVSILIEFEAWNARRTRAGKEPIGISIGLHYGPVVVGNIGTDRRLEFAVLGDTVNVASRLEALTRELDCKAVISAALANAVLIEASGEGSHHLANFAERGPQALKGRAEKVSVLTYG
jgi:adenylate cyclase